MKIINESEYVALLLQSQSASNHFQFRRDYVKTGIMTLTQAAFFQDVLNKITMDGCKHKELEVDGETRIYSMCSTQFLFDSMLWNRDSQKTHFKALKEKGYLDYKTVGKGGRRYVWLNILKVERDVQAGRKSYPGRKSPPGAGRKSPPNQEQENKKESRRSSVPLPPSERNGFASNGHAKAESNGFHANGQTKPSFAAELARRIHDKLMEARKLMRPVRRMSAWTQAIAELVREVAARDKVDNKTARGYVRSVIEDHLTNLDADYQPKLYAAPTMQEGFVKLEDAHKRRLNPKKGEPDFRYC